VSYAGTPSHPSDDFWLSDLSNIGVRGDAGFSDRFCDVMTADLT
jgi:hypothetical protein